MPRKPAAPKKPKAILNRNEVIGLCKRFLKPDEGATRYYDPKTSPMIMYKLIKQYPNREFWLAYQLGFELRSLFWLTGDKGQEKLASDYAVFNLRLKPVEAHVMEDTKVGEDVVVVKRPQTVADLLR